MIQEADKKNGRKTDTSGVEAGDGDDNGDGESEEDMDRETLRELRDLFDLYDVDRSGALLSFFLSSSSSVVFGQANAGYHSRFMAYGR